MNTFELMNELFSGGHSIDQAAALCTKHNNKDIFLAWGKECGYSVKDINSAWKDAQPTKAKAKGFAAEYFEWLAEMPRTEEEANDYIMDPSNSNNTHKHLSHYMNIWALTVAVRGSLEKEREEHRDEMSDEVREAWDFLKAEMESARPRKTKVHPDKVSHLGDAELTKAYTEAFQKLNTKR